MTSTQVEVITSVERRRRWSQADKERLVVASLEPGAMVSAIAREAGIHPTQLYRWRRQFCVRPQASPAFAAVRIASEAGAASGLCATPGAIEIEFGSGARLRITGAVDAATVSAAVAAMAGNAGRR
jgi:transposase